MSSFDKSGALARTSKYEVVWTTSGQDIINLTGRKSGKELNELKRAFPSDLIADKAIALSDLAPAGEHGANRLPTGAAVEIDTSICPEWRKLTISDVGCGIQVVKTNLDWLQFDAKTGRQKWDEVYRILNNNRQQGNIGDLGSGNHFLDAMMDDQGLVYFLIHTGSRNESRKADEMLTHNPEAFDAMYSKITEWARRNRLAVMDVLKLVYGGKFEIVSDTIHNFYQYNRDAQRVVIYKGAVRLEKGILGVIPSSIDGEAVLVEASERLGEETLFAMSHGTGRKMSRSLAKVEARKYDYDQLRRKILTPSSQKNSDFEGEYPGAYRNLDDCLAVMGEFVQVKTRLYPLAYMRP